MYCFPISPNILSHTSSVSFKTTFTNRALSSSAVFCSVVISCCWPCGKTCCKSLVSPPPSKNFANKNITPIMPPPAATPPPLTPRRSSTLVLSVLPNHCIIYFFNNHIKMMPLFYFYKIPKHYAATFIYISFKAHHNFILI